MKQNLTIIFLICFIISCDNKDKKITIKIRKDSLTHFDTPKVDTTTNNNVEICVGEDTILKKNNYHY